MTPINVAFLLPTLEIVQYHKAHCEMEEMDYVDDDEEENDELVYLGFTIADLPTMLIDPATSNTILQEAANFINDFLGTRKTNHDCLSQLTLEGMREYLDYNCTYATSKEEAMSLLIANYIAGGLGINAIYERLPPNLQNVLTVDESTAHFISCQVRPAGLMLDMQLYIKPQIAVTA